jgi:transposase
MRGEDLQQHDLFSYGSLEERIPADHPLRPIRAMVDEALNDLDARFDEIYGEDGRRSIPPERLLRALLLQMLYSVRSERMLMEQLEYNLLFRWFVGLSDGVYEEPGPAAERSGLGGVLHAGGGAGTQGKVALG